MSRWALLKARFMPIVGPIAVSLQGIWKCLSRLVLWSTFGMVLLTGCASMPLVTEETHSRPPQTQADARDMMQHAGRRFNVYDSALFLSKDGVQQQPEGLDGSIIVSLRKYKARSYCLLSVFDVFVLFAEWSILQSTAHPLHLCVLRHLGWTKQVYSRHDTWKYVGLRCSLYVICWCQRVC